MVIVKIEEIEFHRRDLMVFRDNLKNIRVENGITQEELARYLNVTRPTIAGYETKGKEPDYKTLIMLSDFFHVSLDYLLTGHEYYEKILPDDTEAQGAKKLLVEIQSKSSTLSEANLIKLLDYIELLILWENNH